MRWRFHACLVPAFLVFLCTNSFATVEVKVFGTTFTRGTGAPVTESRIINPYFNKGGNANIRITNGGIEGSEANRVSSTTVHINGQRVFGESDFNQKVYSLQKEIFLVDGDNYIDVRLNGKPGGNINVQILQVVAADMSSPEKTIASFGSNLSSLDIFSAVQVFDESVKAEYSNKLNQYTQNLSRFARYFSSGTVIYITDILAKYEINVYENGNQVIYCVMLGKNSNGEWKITAM